MNLKRFCSLGSNFKSEKKKFTMRTESNKSLSSLEITQSIASSINHHNHTINIKQIDDNHKKQYDFTDELAQMSSFWDGCHGIIAFKLIIIGLLLTTVLNLTLCFYIAEYRQILI
eukprot:133529_1